MNEIDLQGNVVYAHKIEFDSKQEEEKLKKEKEEAKEKEKEKFVLSNDQKNALMGLLDKNQIEKIEIYLSEFES